MTPTVVICLWLDSYSERDGKKGSENHKKKQDHQSSPERLSRNDAPTIKSVQASNERVRKYEIEGK